MNKFICCPPPRFPATCFRYATPPMLRAAAATNDRKPGENGAPMLSAHPAADRNPEPGVSWRRGYCKIPDVRRPRLAQGNGFRRPRCGRGSTLVPRRRSRDQLDLGLFEPRASSSRRRRCASPRRPAPPRAASADRRRRSPRPPPRSAAASARRPAAASDGTSRRVTPPSAGDSLDSDPTVAVSHGCHGRHAV